MRNMNNMPLFKIKQSPFANSYFPSTALEQNKLDLSISKSEKVASFRRNLLKFFRHSGNVSFCHEGFIYKQAQLQQTPGI